MKKFTISKISNLATYLDYSLFLPLMSKFPFPIAYGLAKFRGWLQYLARTSWRHHAQDNVSKVFPSLGIRETKKIVAHHFQVESCNEMEAFWYRNPSSFFEDFVEISGLEVLKEAVGSKAGVLLVSGHFGSTGLFFTVVGKQGIKINIVGRPIESQENPLHPARLRYNRKRVRWIEEAVNRPSLLTGKGNYPILLDKLRGKRWS